MRLADQIWVSDNTEATARLNIQEGFSQAYPANTMEAWVTDAWADRISLEFRFHVSMCGSLGVGGNLVEWSAADREVAAQCIRQYKELRPIIQLGDQFRLISPQQHAYSAVQYLSKDKTDGVLFVFRVHIPDLYNFPQLYLRGLEPGQLVEQQFNGRQLGSQRWKSGSSQMNPAAAQTESSAHDCK